MKVMQNHVEEIMKRAAVEGNGMGVTQTQAQMQGIQGHGVGQKVFVSSRDRREQFILGNGALLSF